MKRSIKIIFGVLALTLITLHSSFIVARDADKTKYPIVFAHGMAGFDRILTYDYWGNDFGVFVLDPCNSFLETTCNRNIDKRQKSYISSVQPFESSEVRGLQLADNIESYLATSGESYVNIVGHSQGGLDARKAAKELYQRLGYRVVRTNISISSPHRGSPTAKYMIDHNRDTLLESLAQIYGDAVYEPGNDVEAAMKQLIYDDYEVDGQITGMKAFNDNYPISTTYIENSASIITAQDRLRMNPALWIVSEGFYDIDGDGYCVDDCDGDGAAGAGNGDSSGLDDDGLVGINSQQMGYRLEYKDCFLCMASVYKRTDTGYVGDLNRPSSTQMTSNKYIIEQDHLDIIGVGPDTFDEMEFYAALTDYIADSGN